jgi:hypothetical protein
VKTYYIVKVMVEKGTAYPELQSASLEDAVYRIGNILNGSYYPGEVIYQVLGSESEQKKDPATEADYVYTR